MLSRVSVVLQPASALAASTRTAARRMPVIRPMKTAPPARDGPCARNVAPIQPDTAIVTCNVAVGRLRTVAVEEFNTDGQLVAPNLTTNSGTTTGRKQQQKTLRQFFIRLQDDACAAFRNILDAAGTRLSLLAEQNSSAIVQRAARPLAQLGLPLMAIDVAHSRAPGSTLARFRQEFHHERD